MRSFSTRAAFLAAIAAFSIACPDEEGADTNVVDAIDDRTSDLCDEVFGMEALAWDLYNGVPVADTVLPPPFPTGGYYTHSQVPLLGFSYNTGWTPYEISVPEAFGVDLVRDDSQAIWRYLYATWPTAPDATANLEAEVGVVRGYFGITGQPTVVCSRADTFDPGTGTPASYSNVLLRQGGFTILATSTVYPVPGFTNANAFSRVLVAPTAEFPARAYDSFIAIDWQLLVTGGGDDNDRDNDGWIDSIDEFPDDPTRH